MLSIAVTNPLSESTLSCFTLINIVSLGVKLAGGKVN